MANSIIVVKACVVRHPFLPPKAFAAGEIVQPYSKYYKPLLYSGLATDSGRAGFTDDLIVWNPEEEPSGVFGRASNSSNFPTTAAVNPVIVLGCLVMVPPTKRNVKLRYGGTGKVVAPSATKSGYMNMIVYDITGTPAMSGYSTRPIFTTSQNGDWLGTFNGEVNVGAASNWRKFQLYVNLGVNPGGTAYPQGILVNSPLQESWLEGVAV